MARDADGKPQAPLETRGRRPISQKMRDISDRLKSVGQFAESLPAILKSAMMVSFMAWYVWSCRAQINIVKSTVDPTGRIDAHWDYTPYFDKARVYNMAATLKGEPLARLDVFYPDKNFAHAMLQIGVVMQSTAGDSFLAFAAEGAEAVLIIAILDDIFNKRIFIDRTGEHEVEPIQFGIPATPFSIPIPGSSQVKNWGAMGVKEIWVLAGQPLPAGSEELEERNEQVVVPLDTWFWSWQISHLLAALAFASISWLLITRGPRGLSFK